MASKKAYPPRAAKTVQGGLRLQSSRRIAWWRRRWVAFMENLNMGARLGRGKNYAQLGQIQSLTLLPGRIEATIQGAAEEPYELSIEMDLLPQKEISDYLAKTPAITAQFYTHNLPMSFENELQSRGLSLFPASIDDLRMHCSCKDWSKPCKHLAAALFLFIDAISVDPRLLLRFRGIDLVDPKHSLFPQIVPLNQILHLSPPVSSTAVVSRLGAFPYWRGTDDPQKNFETTYQRTRDKAMSFLENHSADFRFPTDFPVIKDTRS